MVYFRYKNLPPKCSYCQPWIQFPPTYDVFIKVHQLPP